VLRNLKAPFVAGRAVIVGAPRAFSPVDIHTKATTFKDEKGWFGDRVRTFAALPAGRGKYAGVEFDVYEMPTSPTPQVLMLRGDGAPGDLPERISDIPVNQKADALFFLHAAKLTKRMSAQERAERKSFVLFNYVVNYVDGRKIEIPIRAELDIEHYVQHAPAAIQGAQLGWTAPYDGGREHAAAYAKQWNNPRPDVAIASVDMVPVDPSRGAPVLLALTAAAAE
jgi:beta-galactosidase